MVTLLDLPGSMLPTKQCRAALRSTGVACGVVRLFELR
jgi:hypothetical protein